MLEAEDNATPAADDRGAVSEPVDRTALGLFAAFAAVAAATIYLSFNAGGFFVFAPAVVTVLALVGLLLHVMVARQPFAGLSRTSGVAVAGIALYALWTLVSAIWSDSSARAMIEFDRALLYAVALLLGTALPWSAARVRAMLGGLTFAAAVIAVIALITRLLPKVWPLAENVSPDRLSYPLTYWNALGLLAGIGLGGALHFASDERERAAVRVGATVLIPLQVAVLYFTLSRGPMAATAVGIVLYLVLARSKGVLFALLCALPASVAVVLAGYSADALTSDKPTVGDAIGEGHRVALILAAGLVVTALLRLALLGVERRLRLPSVRLPLPGWAAALIVLVVVAGALTASGVVQHAVHNFGQTDAIANLGDQRQRLFSASNNGRFDHWRVAFDGFKAHPLDGTGAGTYELEWAQLRNENFTVVNAHSLYAQTLGELGIVGLVLLLVGLAAIVVGLVTRLRGPHRQLIAAVTALAAVWLIHAGIDWDWEMPAITLWFFAIGGAAIAGAAPAVSASIPWIARRTPRLVVGLCCLLLAITPVLLGLSQRQLDEASAAFDQRDCSSAIDHGLSSISILGARPEPYALVGLCDVRLGVDDLGLRMLQNAIDRDPHDWEYRYALAIAQAFVGQDPRVQARLAHQLNPLDPRSEYALELYGRGDPAGMRSRAADAPAPW